MRNLFFLCFMMIHHLVNADGRPFDGLQNPQFQLLKTEVVQYLKNSWCSAQKAELIMDLIYSIQPEVCVEIGVFKGSSFLPIGATLKFLKMGQAFAIDAWSNEEAVKYLSYKNNHHAWWSNVDLDHMRNEFDFLIEQWSMRNYCVIVHAPSLAAVEVIPEIDFLHLDGNFSDVGSLLDVELYLPKVKSGGYILLSNVYLNIDNVFVKMPSMWKLFDECDLICEVDETALFRKN